MDNKENDINKQLNDFRKTAEERAKKAISAFDMLKDAFAVVDKKELTINGQKVVIQLSKRGIVSISHVNIDEARATYDSFINQHS